MHFSKTLILRLIVPIQFCLFLVFRALSDNVLHGLIAVMCYLSIHDVIHSYSSVIRVLCDVIIAFTSGCIVDVDHFIAAKSFSLQVQ